MNRGPLEPDSKYGYTATALKEHLGQAGWAEFAEWMFGQTYCSDPETGEFVFYERDVDRFLARVVNRSGGRT